MAGDVHLGKIARRTRRIPHQNHQAQTAGRTGGAGSDQLQRTLRNSSRRCLAEAVQPVPQAHQRMLPQHARPGVTHDDAHLLAAFALVAMHWTLGARWLFQAKPTAFQPHIGIVQKLLTSCTQTASRVMLVTAINPNHGRHGLPFACQSGAGQIIFCFDC